MSSYVFFFFFIPLLAFILLGINFIFAPHNPYQEKNGAFECGYTSFLGQNRTQFSISFFIFALLFLLFDLEILLVYPYLVSSYNNESYGLSILLVFLMALTLGFVFELGKKALTIDSKQTIQNKNTNTHMNTAMIIPITMLSNILCYVICYISYLFITFFCGILKYSVVMLLNYIFNIIMSHLSFINTQPRLVNLSMQLITICFFTLSYNAYQGCYNEQLNSIIIILIIC